MFRPELKNTHYKDQYVKTDLSSEDIAGNQDGQRSASSPSDKS